MSFIINKHGTLYFQLPEAFCRLLHPSLSPGTYYGHYLQWHRRFNKSLLSKVSRLCSRPKHELSRKLLEEVARISGRSKILNKVDVCVCILGTLYFLTIVIVFYMHFSETWKFYSIICSYEACYLFIFKTEVGNCRIIRCHITSIWMFCCRIYTFIKNQLLSS